MEKTELIQTHRMMAMVAHNLSNNVNEVDLTMDDLEQYQKVGTKPIDIHKKIDDHEKAIFALMDDLTSHLDDGEEDTDEVEEIASELLKA